MKIHTEVFPSLWDKEKEMVFSQIDTIKCFSDLSEIEIGNILNGDWYRLSCKDKTIGYGWIVTDNSCFDPIYKCPELLICISKDHQGVGAGRKIFSELITIAKHKNIKMVKVYIRRSNIDFKRVVKLAVEHGFSDFENRFKTTIESVLGSENDPISLGLNL